MMTNSLFTGYIDKFFFSPLSDLCLDNCFMSFLRSLLSCCLPEKLVIFLHHSLGRLNVVHGAISGLLQGSSSLVFGN